MRNCARYILRSVVFAMALVICSPGADAQIQVTSAVPNNAAQGTVNLDVVVKGNGFKKGAKAQWFVTGTTNPGGVTVNSTAFNSAGQLTANITVASDAVTASFDIVVKNSDGRTGKGTELFAVQSKAAACPAPVPLNPPVSSFACSTATGQTCLDSTFGNSTQLPPGGLVLTNTDGSIPSTNDIDYASAVHEQLQPDGSLKLIAIGTTSNPNGNGQQGVAVVRYNLDGTLDPAFASSGITKFFPGTTFALVHGGAIDASGKILGVADQNPAALVVRFTVDGALDTTFNSTGYVSLTTVKPVGGIRLQSDGKILVAGTQLSGKSIVGVVVRLNANGTLDATFGSNGVATISSVQNVYALALQSSNSQQFILAGGAGASGNGFAVVRLSPSGSVDSSFGASGGVATTNFCGLPSNVYSLAVDPIGNILAGGAGPVVSKGPPDFYIARFTGNGVLDTTFGDSSTTSSGRTGQTMLDFFGSQNYLMSIQPVLDSAGNEVAFMAGGYAYQPSGLNTFHKYLVIAKYDTSGSLDPTFGTNGVVSVDFGSSNNSAMSPAGNSLLIQTDGKVVIGGTSGFTSGPFSGYNFALARFWP
jgi:uncharacterized delta-60 repeat protein